MAPVPTPTAAPAAPRPAAPAAAPIIAPPSAPPAAAPPAASITPRSSWRIFRLNVLATFTGFKTLDPAGDSITIPGEVSYTTFLVITFFTTTGCTACGAPGIYRTASTRCIGVDCTVCEGAC